MQQPGQTPADTETLQKQADELTRVLETTAGRNISGCRWNNWRLPAKTKPNGRWRRKFSRCILDYDIAPLPNEGRFSYYARNSSDLSWKNDQLNIIRANKLSLLSGELNSNPIDSTTRARRFSSRSTWRRSG